MSTEGSGIKMKQRKLVLYLVIYSICLFNLELKFFEADKQKRRGNDTVFKPENEKNINFRCEIEMKHSYMKTLNQFLFWNQYETKSVVYLVIYSISVLTLN